MGEETDSIIRAVMGGTVCSSTGFAANFFCIKGVLAETFMVILKGVAFRASV